MGPRDAQATWLKQHTRSVPTFALPCVANRTRGSVPVISLGNPHGALFTTGCEIGSDQSASSCPLSEDTSLAVHTHGTRHKD